MRGLLLGAEVRAGLASFVPQPYGANLVSPKALSRITSIAYSTVFDQKARVGTTIECASITAASLVTQFLSVLAKLGIGLPLSDIRVSNLANRVYLTGSADPEFAKELSASGH